MLLATEGAASRLPPRRATRHRGVAAATLLACVAMAAAALVFTSQPRSSGLVFKPTESQKDAFGLLAAALPGLLKKLLSTSDDDEAPKSVQLGHVNYNVSSDAAGEIAQARQCSAS